MGTLFVSRAVFSHDVRPVLIDVPALPIPVFSAHHSTVRSFDDRTESKGNLTSEKKKTENKQQTNGKKPHTIRRTFHPDSPPRGGGGSPSSRQSRGTYYGRRLTHNQTHAEPSRSASSSLKWWQANRKSSLGFTASRARTTSRHSTNWTISRGARGERMRVGLDEDGQNAARRASERASGRKTKQKKLGCRM